MKAFGYAQPEEQLPCEVEHKRDALQGVVGGEEDEECQKEVGEDKERCSQAHLLATREECYGNHSTYQ